MLRHRVSDGASRSAAPKAQQNPFHIVGKGSDLPLTPTVVGLVLLAAALHAGWNTIVKTGVTREGADAAETDGYRLLTPTLVILTSSAVALALTPFANLPAAPSWPYLIASVLIHTAYFAFLTLSYRVGDLSHVYPLARGVGPLVVAIASSTAFGEALGSYELAGILLISLGVASLAFQPGFATGDRRPLVFALLTGTMIASYTIVDAIGIRRSGSPLGYIAWLMLLTGLPFAGYALARTGRAGLGFMRRHWKPGVVGGIMTFSAYGLVLWALNLGAVAPIAALRESSVVMAALIGTLFLGEPFGFRRVVAAIVVLVGVVIMNWAE